MPAVTSAPKPPSPQVQQQQQAAAANAQAGANWDYLRTCYRKKAVCPPASGAGINQTYVSGQTLIYDVPTVQGGFLESLLFQCSLTVNPATGTAAAYALTKYAPWTLIDSVEVEYNNKQVRMRPFILKTIELLAGYERAQPEQVLSGQAIASLTSSVWGSPFALTVSTNNPWNFWFRLPLRGFIPRSAAGMLPIQGDSTRAQVKIICASSAVGTATVGNADPIFNAVAWTGGTGPGATVGGTIKVLAEYRDGMNMVSPTPKSLSLDSLPTVQWYIDRQLNPLVAASINRQRIDTKLQHLYVISAIIDGVQYTDLALNSNIQALELDQDSGGQNAFYRYGVNGSNVLVPDFLEEYERNGTYGLGQDLDQGIIAWIPGPGYLSLNRDLMEGGSYLNMGSGGYPDTNYAVQVAATGTICTPRVETYLVSINPLGLIKS